MNICKQLGIDIPIIQAPMAGVQDWQLAVAVSNAGGLGSIPCGMLSPEKIIEEITSFQSHSDKPYNLNFFCHEMPQLNPKQIAEWEKTLTPFFKKLEVQPPSEFSGLRRPFDEKTLELLRPFRSPILSFHFGLPPNSLLTELKSWGTKIISSATTVEEGLWLEVNGADMVIAQGVEAGGHRAMFLTKDHSTQMGTIELTKQLLTHLSLPIISAGAITNSKQTQRHLKFGASAVQIGTTYLLCHEAKTSTVHRQALKDQTRDTALTNLFSGRLARGMINTFMEKLGPINEKAPDFPYASNALTPLRRKAESLNSEEFSPLWSGTNRSGCQEISAYELTKTFYHQNSSN
ncbi:2-nitropropane dioxygenase [Shewanella sp. OPT22]|nr:2-nitropropane dioxygenase [Shewanella sp. OPT22]